MVLALAIVSSMFLLGEFQMALVTVRSILFTILIQWFVLIVGETSRRLGLNRENLDSILVRKTFSIFVLAVELLFFGSFSDPLGNGFSCESEN